MHSRAIIVALAAAAFTGGSALAAEPSNTPPSQSDQSQSDQAPAHRAEIVLASADQVTSNPANPPAQASARPHRVARVTTCRCGGQESQPDE
jgi:hypothetical protein